MAEILFGMLKADFDTGIKFVLGDPGYRWSLKDHQVHSSKALSGWAGNVRPNIPTNSQRNLLILSRNFNPEDSIDRSIFEHSRQNPY